MTQSPLSSKSPDGTSAHSELTILGLKNANDGDIWIRTPRHSSTIEIKADA